MIIQLEETEILKTIREKFFFVDEHSGILLSPLTIKDMINKKEDFKVCFHVYNKNNQTSVCDWLDKYIRIENLSDKFSASMERMLNPYEKSVFNIDNISYNINDYTIQITEQAYSDLTKNILTIDQTKLHHMTKNANGELSLCATSFENLKFFMILGFIPSFDVLKYIRKRNLQ